MGKYKRTTYKDRRKGQVQGGYCNTRLDHLDKKKLPEVPESGWVVGFDYLRLKVEKIDYKEVCSLIKNFFPVELIRDVRQTGWSAPGYTDRYTDRYMDSTTKGFLLVRDDRDGEALTPIPNLYSNEKHNQLLAIWLELPGKWWQGRGICEGLNNIYYLTKVLGGTITRLDIRIDMYSDCIHAEDIKQAITERNFARIRTATEYIVTSSDTEKIPVTGFTFGSRESDLYTRYYDAKPIHNIDARRWEAEFKGEKVRALVPELQALADLKTQMIGNIDEFGSKDDIGKHLSIIIAQYALGGVEFIQRDKLGKRGNLKKIHRLEWWQKAIDKVGEVVRVYTQPKKPNISKTINFFYSIRRSLAMVKEALGTEKFLEWFRRTIADGKEKLSRAHLQCLHEYQYYTQMWDDSFIDCTT